jgi:glucose-1-phosphate cytidylyltransferase
MKTAILCGGFGTRIRDVADDLPKPMIPVGGLPILWHIMKYYASWDFKRFVLALGYRSNVIKQFFLNYEAYTNDFTITLGNGAQPRFESAHPETGWEVTLAETGLLSMTGTRVALMKKYLDGEENFFLTYGDGVSDVDLARLLAFHQAHGRILTVTGVHPPGRFGELEYGHDQRVTGFNEKPQVTGGRISAGFFVCRRQLFDYLDPHDEQLVLEQGPMRRLVQDGQLMVYEHEGFWHPMDTYRDYKFLNELHDKGQAPWRRWK